MYIYIYIYSVYTYIHSVHTYIHRMNFLPRFLKKTLAVQKKLTFSMLDCWRIGRKGVNNKTL